jgi:PAS domain S-box-containing protein/putative nucleotidyltransferase with HDIG domain
LQSSPKIATTKKKDVSDLLRLSEVRYRRLFESAQDGILILDFSTGAIQDANPFIIKLLGFSSEELIGKQLWQIGPIVDKLAALKAYETVKETGYFRYNDLPLMTKDGHLISVEVVSNAYGVNGERVIQCNIRDITDRKLLALERLEYLNSITTSMSEMVEALSNVIVARDPYTAGHQKRVSSLSVAIGTKLNIPWHSIEGIRMAALLHDIGKISIPTEVLIKSTVLSNFDIGMLQNHSQTGYDILKNIHFPWNIAQTVLQHHERLDGSGYPNALKEDAICQEARIIAVADTVEAMSSDRPYRKGKGIAAALDEIEMGSGKQFDADVVAACLKIFREDSYTFPSEN